MESSEFDDGYPILYWVLLCTSYDTCYVCKLRSQMYLNDGGICKTVCRGIATLVSIYYAHTYTTLFTLNGNGLHMYYLINNNKKHP